MSVYCRLAANSIQNQRKRGGAPKRFGQDCPKSCILEITSKLLLICIFQFWLLQKCAKCFNFNMSDEYLQVLGLTQPTVLTLEWIRGIFLVSQSASVVNLLLIIPQSIPSGTFSVKTKITCKITVFME